MILGDNTYYVSSSITSDCPQPCHPLSYYITNTGAYFTSNATFIFMEGEHKLNSNGSTKAVINNVDNLTLRGERNHSSTDIIIRCSSNTRGIVFNNGSIINIYGITITGCGQQDIATLLFINIASLYIHNITVYNNTYNTSTGGGIMYIHCVNNKHNIITIANSTFINNTVGYGGGLFIGTDIDSHNNINITDSTFTNNTVGNDGGGLLIYTDAHDNVTITNSAFTNNTVDRDGGGLYIFIDNDAHNNILITNSSFTNNKVGGYGGGLIISVLPNAQDNIIITNSTFTKNSVSGLQGGGLYIGTEHAHNNITIANSSFANNIIVENGGGLLIITADVTDVHSNITITNSAFNSNTVGGRWGGGLCIIYMYTDTYLDNILTITNSTFANNNGSGIFSINRITVMFTEGHSIVANNSSPKDGGGIHLSENSYLTTSNGGHVSFINNTAQGYGGAIYSTDNDYASLLYIVNSRPYRKYADQCTVYNLSATFINNSAAKAGDNLYGGVLTLCNKVHAYYIEQKYLQYLFNCTNVPDTLKHATSVHPLSPVSSDPIAVCPCVTGTVDCNIISLNREVYPGQLLNVSLVTVGLCGRVSPGTVVVEHGDHINLISAATTDYTSNSCTTLNYTVKLINYTSNTCIKFNVPDGDLYGIRTINVNLTILPCPLGLVVNFTLGDCVCNNDITHISGVICNISWMPAPYPIRRSGNNWIYHRYDYYDCTIAHIGCPFDYCNTATVKLNLSKSDLQCNFNRSGVLCGQCIQGFSLMIGSNRCANCTDTTFASVSIVIIAAVAGVVLVILLMVLCLLDPLMECSFMLIWLNLMSLFSSLMVTYLL